MSKPFVPMVTVVVILPGLLVIIGTEVWVFGRMLPPPYVLTWVEALVYGGVAMAAYFLNCAAWDGSKKLYHRLRYRGHTAPGNENMINDQLS